MRIGFGDCVFDSDTREVVREGRVLPLAPKAFQLLDILLRERPKAVSKERLHEELWPKTFVADANIANLVADLRGALGDDAKHPRIIRTVQRFGYAFEADTTRAPREIPEGGHGRRLWIRDLEGRTVRAVTPESTFRGLVSPDGRFASALGTDRVYRVYPIEGGGEGKKIEGLRAGEEPIQWSRDGRTLFLRVPGGSGPDASLERIDRLDP